MKQFPPPRDYSSLSVRDLIEARDAYHLANVTATEGRPRGDAAGRPDHLVPDRQRAGPLPARIPLDRLLPASRNRCDHADLLDHAWREVGTKVAATSRNLTLADLHPAIMEGAVERVRPEMMTVVAIMAGLIPILWSTGTGSEVMQRIAVYDRRHGVLDRADPDRDPGDLWPGQGMGAGVGHRGVRRCQAGHCRRPAPAE